VIIVRIIIMAEEQQRSKAIGFKTVQLLKDQTLGIGSYGKVCKAKCDDLLCAAKLIHETLFDPTAQQLIAPQREHRLPMRRFEQECEFLSTIRHPNIVQYLGIYRDPDTGLPALLMELMDDSLTHFLESSPQPIPYHIQVNICHDITLALSFLHSNGIVHRDLSSNNVLLRSNVLAKVTDFGMARLGDQNPRATQLTFTMCPGTDVYMPPEAVQDKPEYTDKIDCFSFGVITLQILTQEFPNPGDRRKRIEIDHSGFPKGTLIEARISEVERRQNHIDKIEPNHTLLPIVLDCLKDGDVERPSAQQLCERVVALKDGPQYSESIRAVKARSSVGQGGSDERDRELRSLRQQHSQQVRGLQQIIESQTSRLEQALREKDATIAAEQQQLQRQVNENFQLMREKDQVIEEKKRIERQLEESETMIAQFQRRIVELEQLRPAADATPRSKELSSSRAASIKLTWREGKKAPCQMRHSYCSAVDSNMLYVKVGPELVYAFTISTSIWSLLPNCPYVHDCPLVIISNLLTLIGGDTGVVTIDASNGLFSLTGEGSARWWTEEFPFMPTKRRGSTALCTETALIVVGGMVEDYSPLNLIEIMNTVAKQWSTAADLPRPVVHAPVAVCGDRVYILGKTSMYTCSVVTLVQSCKSFLASLRKGNTGVWSELAASPVTRTTCVSIHGRLLAIGGTDSDDKPTTAIHIYNPTTDSWEVVSHMGTARMDCVAAVLHNNQLMVAGGHTSEDISGTDSVEFASVEYIIYIL
jgi:serine/threonine protein kinase